jgi:GNAT superfamily N-acetyltransferase
VELVLRGIERDEVAAAVALIEEATLSPGVEDPARLDDYWEAVLEVRRRGGELLVATRGDDVVGMCQIIIFRHFQHTAGWCAELESVYVRSDVRGQGVGAALLVYAEDLARAKGCYRVQLASRNERTDAHRFYSRYGYVLTSQGFKKPLVE